jgi:hypothetical protein
MKLITFFNYYVNFYLYSHMILIQQSFMILFFLFLDLFVMYIYIFKRIVLIKFKFVIKNI